MCHLQDLGMKFCSFFQNILLVPAGDLSVTLFFTFPSEMDLQAHGLEGHTKNGKTTKIIQSP